MATNQMSLTEKLAERANQVTKPDGGKKHRTIVDLINSMKDEIAKALPKHITPERMARVALTTIRLNPKLQQCNPQSLLGALMLSAQLGLEPGPLGHCYLVPYGQECQMIIGYKGMIDLMWRSGQYRTLYVMDIRENDECEIEYGSNPKLYHKPAKANRGKPVYYYLFAEYKDGGKFWHVMSIEEIEQHRKRSKSANNGPWVTDWEAMAKKTVVRSASRWMPMSIELQRQLAQDEMVTERVDLETGEVSGDFDLGDADYQVVDDPNAGQGEAQADG